MTTKRIKSTKTMPPPATHIQKNGAKAASGQARIPDKAQDPRPPVVLGTDDVCAEREWAFTD
jgi:hypothetical protein